MQDRRNSRFVEVDFTGSRFHGVDLTGVTISDAWLVDVDISGRITGLTVNGVDVTAFVDQQLDERHPIRKLLTATDPDGMRQAWTALEQAAAGTLDRAGRLPADALDRSVGGEWSYLQTLRHLVFATDRWITGPVLGEPEPFHPLGLPNTPHDDLPPGPFDIEARPSLGQVLEARQDRMGRIGRLLSAITPEQVAAEVPSPNGGATTVGYCLQVVFREEWWHDQYAKRDLAVLEQEHEQEGSA